MMGTLPAGYSAHPHQDPETGELHAVSYNWLRGNRVDYTVRDTEGRVRRHEPIQVGGSPMMHDFALTENYVVIYDLPVVFDKRRALQGMPLAARIPTRLMMAAIIGRNPLPDPVISRIARGSDAGGSSATLPYSWDPDYPARIGLLPREGTDTDTPMVRHRPVLRLPHAERLRGRRHSHHRRGAPRPDVRHRAQRPRRRAADTGPVHHRPQWRQGSRGPLRRPRSGVPALRRAADREATPLGYSVGLPGGPARRLGAASRPRGRLNPRT